MLSKLDTCENLYDHEILEMLLFHSLPRLNTNPIAHNLLDRFGSLHELFKADKAELKTVEGVGERTANLIRIVGLCSERAGKAEGVFKVATVGDLRRFTELRLKGKTEEFLEIYLLDKSNKIIRILTHTSASVNSVKTRTDELVRNIALSKCSKLFVTHNHPNGSPRPSEADIGFTKKLQLICIMNGVEFYDHLIYADGKFYSFRDEDKLDEIKRECSLEKILEWTKI